MVTLVTAKLPERHGKGGGGGGSFPGEGRSFRGRCWRVGRVSVASSLKAVLTPGGGGVDAGVAERGGVEAI